MTHYIAEAKRLGLDTSYVPAVKQPTGRIVDGEGLCVTGCPVCRKFRNKVRAALEAEQQTKAEAFETLTQQFRFSSEDMARAYANGRSEGLRLAGSLVVDLFDALSEQLYREAKRA